MRKVLKWIISILLLAGLVGGGYLIYRHWKKNHSTAQNNQQIKDFEEVIQQLKQETQHNKEYYNKLLNKTLKEGEGSYPRDEPPKIPNWEQKNEKTEKLEKEFQQAWKEFSDITNQIGEYWNKIEKEVADDEKLYEIQKNWKAMTFKLGKDPEVRACFNAFIKTFFYRFLTEKGLIRSETDFKGFGNFYVDPRGTVGISEMGNCGPPEDDKDIPFQGDKITRLPIIIKLNQLYLLNNGKNGSMDRFISEIKRNSKGKVISRSALSINFDNLIETIAHELAHAIQEVKNIDHYEHGKEGIILTQCESSGEGERDPNNPLKLTKPKYPEWVKEHAQLTEEIRQMIINSSEYKEFEKWWKSP